MCYIAVVCFHICLYVTLLYLLSSGSSRVRDVQTEDGGLAAVHRGPAHAEGGFYEQRGKVGLITKVIPDC